MRLDLTDAVLRNCANQASLLDDGVLHTTDEFRSFFSLIMLELSKLAYSLQRRNPPEPAEI